jgi:hypothetical protein
MVRGFQLGRRRKLSAGVHSKLVRGLAGAARSAAEAGKCDVAEVLLAFAGNDLRAAAQSSGARPAKYMRYLGVASQAADAAAAIIRCRQGGHSQQTVSPPQPKTETAPLADGCRAAGGICK